MLLQCLWNTCEHERGEDHNGLSAYCTSFVPRSWTRRPNTPHLTVTVIVGLEQGEAKAGDVGCPDTIPSLVFLDA